MNTIKRVIERMEAADVSLGAWLAGFAGIIFVRFFLENLSSPTPSFPAVYDTLTLVHYALFYLAEILALSLVVRAFVKEDVSRITKVLLFGFLTLWIAPIIDLAVHHGAGSTMAYIFDGPLGLINDFLTLGGSLGVGGITIGIKTELVLAMLLVAGYVWIKTKKPIRAIVAAIAGYAALFIMLSLPSWIALFSGVLGSAGAQAYSIQNFLISLFGLSHMPQNFVMTNVQYSFAHAVEAVFSLGIGMVIYLIDFVLVAAWLSVYRRAAFRAIVRNIRPERIVHYILMTIAGAVIATVAQKATFTGFDAIAFIVLLLAIASAWCFAVCVNDAADVGIDAVSNKNRPLVTGALSREEMKGAALFFLLSALAAGYLSGYWAFFCVIVFCAVFYIHAVPPLRLKRVPGVATLIIAFASLASAMAGFYFVDTNHLLADFPKNIALLIVVCFTLGLNFKDMKDIDGDRAEGVMTIPVLFAEYGREVTGALFACAFLAVPAVLGSWTLFWPSVVAGAIGYFIMVAKPYREWRVFVLWFAYLAVLVYLLLF